ncbi:MAG: tetratricopeptide repeat protein [Bacteroidia bacterium]
MLYFVRIFCIISLTYLFSVSLFAQGDTKITAGIVSYESQDYEKAASLLEEGLGVPEVLKPDNLAAGHYYLGMTYVRLYQASVLENNPAILKNYPEPSLMAYHNFRRSLETDASGRWKEKTLAQMNELEPMLTQTGLTYMSMGTGSSLSGREKSVVLTLAFDYFEALTELVPHGYINYDLLGQVRLAQKDSLGALRDFLTAIDLYKRFPPEMPDLLVGYIYYRASILHRYLKNDKKKALAELQAGLAVLDQEYEKLQKWSGGMENLRVQRMDRQYKDAINNLRSMELDLYLNSPDLYPEAQAKFEKAIADDPQNYMLRVAYASLLESVDIDKAISQYQQAIALDDKQETALFNLGALLVNKGMVLQRQSNETADAKLAVELAGKGNAYFQQALSWLEKAYLVKPEELNTVRAILQISLQLNEMATYKKYKTIEAKLTGQ